MTTATSGESTTSESTTSTSSGTSTGSTSTTGEEPQLGPLIVHPDNPAWFYREGQGPYFVCGPGDPEDFFFRGELLPDGTRDGDQDALIAKVAPTGANAIYFQAVRSHGGDGEDTHNPFIGHDPGQGLNPAVLDQWEGWLMALSDAGVVPFFFIYDDDTDPWSSGSNVTAGEQAFVTELVERFADVPLLVWVVAEEYAEALPPARVSALAAIIRENDPVHPISIHQNKSLDFDFTDDPNIDQFALQWDGTAVELRDGIKEAFADAEGAYNVNMSEASQWGTGQVHREKSWAIATAGAYVMVLGMDIASTPEADLEACGHLVDFFHATPDFINMVSHDELSLTPGSYVFAVPGQSYIVYAPAAETVGVAGLEPGSYTLHWLDPTTGVGTEETVEVVGSEASWPRPAEIGAEVALSVVRN